MYHKLTVVLGDVAHLVESHPLTDATILNVRECGSLRALFYIVSHEFYRALILARLPHWSICIVHVYTVVWYFRP